MSPMPTSGHSVLTVEMVQYFPLRSIGAVPAHSARIWSIASANMSLRSASSSPSASASERRMPAPMPKMNRPSNRLSSIAGFEATTTGWLCGRLTTAVPTFICEVAPSSVAININVLGRVGEVLAAIAFAVSEPVGENKGFPILLERLDVAPCRGMHRHREIAKFHAFLRGAPRVGEAALLSRASLCTRGGPRCRGASRPRAGGVVAPQYCVRDQGGALIEYRPSMRPGWPRTRDRRPCV